MKRTAVVFVFTLMMCGFCLFLVTPARADVGYGRFTLLPEIALEETWRSNIFLTQSDRKSDFVTSIAPGLGLKYLFGEDNSLALGYRVGFLEFAKYSNLDYQDHRAYGLLKFVAPGGLQLTLGDNFTKSAVEPIGIITRERPYYDNIANGSAAYGFADRWRIEGKVSREDDAWGEPADRIYEYGYTLMGMDLYYRLVPRMSGLVEYDYAVKDFVTARIDDHKDQLAYLGLAFDPTGKLKGTFKVGYGWKEFDEDIVGRDNTPHSWVMAVQLVDDFDSRTKATLDTQRAFADDSDAGNASYIDTLASLSFQHYFTGKIGGMGKVSYQQGDYVDRFADPVTGQMVKRLDKVWVFGAAGFYDIQKWLQVRLEYQFQDRNSNVETYSYIDHRVVFRLVFSL